MKQKLPYILICITLIAVSLVMVWYFKSNANQTVQKTVSEIVPSVTPIIEMTTWEDQAEYSFQYPKELAINPHDEDQVNYSHVELISATHSGSLISWVKDTTAAGIDAWLKQNKITDAIDSTLGGEPAKKVLIMGDTRKITLTTIKNGYLYQLEATLDSEGYFNNVFDKAASTYTFTGTPKQEENPVQQSQNDDSGGGADEEETIE